MSDSNAYTPPTLDQPRDQTSPSPAVHDSQPTPQQGMAVGNGPKSSNNENMAHSRHEWSAGLFSFSSRSKTCLYPSFTTWVEPHSAPDHPLLLSRLAGVPMPLYDIRSEQIALFAPGESRYTSPRGRREVRSGMRLLYDPSTWMDYAGKHSIKFFILTSLTLKKYSTCSPIP